MIRIYYLTSMTLFIDLNIKHNLITTQIYTQVYIYTYIYIIIYDLLCTIITIIYYCVETFINDKLMFTFANRITITMN